MKKEFKIVLGSALFGFLLWTIDAFIDYSFSLGKPFIDHFFGDLTPVTVFKRLGLFLFFIILITACFKFLITRPQAEKLIGESEKKYRHLIENLQEGVIILQDNKVRFANRKALEIFGFPEQELLSRPFIEFIHPDNREMILQNYQKRIAGEKIPRSYPIRVLKKTEEVIWVQVTDNHFSWKGKPALLYCLSDLTAHKNAQEAMAQHLALEKLVAEISARFINLSHQEIGDEIKHTLEVLGKFWAVDYAALALLNLNQNNLDQIFAWTSLSAEESKTILAPLPLSSCPWLGPKLMAGEIINIPQIADLPEEAKNEKEFWQAQAFQSLLAVPLIMGSNLIGFLAFAAQNRRIFGKEEDIKILKMIAEIFTNVIAQKRNEEALQKIQESFQWLAQESASIAEIGRIVNSTLHIEEVYEVFASEARKLISFDRLAIVTINREENTFTISYVSGSDVQGREQGQTISLSGSVMEQVIRTRGGIVIGEDNKERLLKEFPNLGPIIEAGFRSVIMVPLIFKNEVIGALNLQSIRPDAYSPVDVKFLERIAAQISGAIANAQLYARQKQVEEALRTSEKRYRLLVENAPLGILSINRQGFIIDANPILINLLDLPSLPSLSQVNVLTLPTFQKTGLAENFHICMQTNKGGVFETPYAHPHGKELYLRYHLTPMFSADGQISGMQAIMEDTSERKKLEKQLIHAQKMEAIGTLAGGIAHDFNNILSAIIGYMELASFDLPAESRALLNLQSALKASQRAKDLIKQILTFSRYSDQSQKPLQIAPLIKETIKLLRASLPATIEIRQDIENYQGIINANPTQIHQVLMNLCTNAAQAMRSKGSVLEISLRTIEVHEQNNAQFPELAPGSYVQLSVQDDGEGMPPEILGKIFDPYFTTKKVGEGTGLGLAVVHGIVKNHGGAISVKSELGQGSVFNIFFPLIGESEEISEFSPPEFPPLGEKEKILLVDDEQILAEVGKKMLEHLGYEVTTRTSSIEALELFRNQPHRFNLVITDMTMPNMTGDRLAQELINIRPDLPIILCTGYSEKISQGKAKSLGISEFIMKPFAINELGRAVRRAFDHKKASISV